MLKFDPQDLNPIDPEVFIDIKLNLHITMLRAKYTCTYISIPGSLKIFLFTIAVYFKL
jgi:hypothetical protein